jgi:hypothetical protein
MRLAAAIILIAACKEEPSPSRAGDGSSHLQAAEEPVVVVTKSEIACSRVVTLLQSAVTHEDAATGQLVRLKAPVILAACIDDAWPLELKACIASTPTPDLISKHVCDKLVTDELAQKLLDRLAPGQRLSARDFLQR